MILLELFSGIGGFAKGLEEAGLQFRKVFFSEVDKHAIANYKYNFKESIYVGSVKHVRGIIRAIKSELQPGEQLIITFGSPCQDFSLAGKRSGLDGDKSSLIKYALFLIKWLRPDVYIWENVKGAYSTNAGADFWAIMQAFANIDGYRREQQLLNTSWFLPQNRERIYFIGHATGRSECGVFPIGENNSIHNQSTKNSQETYTGASCLMAEAYNKNTGNYVSVTNLQGKEICNTIRTGGHQSLSDKHNWDFIQIATNTKQGFEIATIGDTINLSVPTSTTRRGRVGKQQAQTIDTQANQAVVVENKIQYKDWTQSQDNRVHLINGISPALGSSNGSSKPKIEVQAVSTPDRKVKNQNGPRIKEHGQPAFTITNETDGVMIDKKHIRRLTEIECERLQGFPDDWTMFGVYDGTVKQIPKTQRYKLLGNAVSVCMPREIGKRLKLNNW